MKTDAIKWTELEVHDTEGPTGDTIENFVKLAPANFDCAVIDNGRLVVWPQFMLAAPGEEPDYDTPRGAVDWAGFENALSEARA